MSEKFYSEIGEYTPDGLITSTKIGLITKGVFFDDVGLLKRGSLIGRTTDNKYNLMGAVAGMSVVGVLSDDIDTSIVNAGVLYLTGCFNKNNIIVADGYTIDEDELRQLSVYLEEVIK